MRRKKTFVGYAIAGAGSCLATSNCWLVLAVAPSTVSAHARDQWRRPPRNSRHTCKVALESITGADVARASKSSAADCIQRLIGKVNPRLLARPAASTTAALAAATSSALFGALRTFRREVNP